MKKKWIIILSFLPVLLASCGTDSLDAVMANSVDEDGGCIARYQGEVEYVPPGGHSASDQIRLSTPDGHDFVLYASNSTVQANLDQVKTGGIFQLCAEGEDSQQGYEGSYVLITRIFDLTP